MMNRLKLKGLLLEQGISQSGTGTSTRTTKALKMSYFIYFSLILEHFENCVSTIFPLHDPYFHAVGTVKYGGGNLIRLPGKYTLHVCPETPHTLVRTRARMQKRSGGGRRAKTLESCIHLEVNRKNPGTPPSEPLARLLLSPPLQPQWPQRCGSL